MPDWLKTGWNHVWLPYAQMQTAPMPAAVVRTQGSRIFLADGRVLIDGIASWWTACHGYNHPHIKREVAAQLEVMPHVMFGGLAHEQAYRLATRLAGLMPPGLERVFFTDSGSVAVEVAIKIAVQARLNKGERGRNKILAFTGGYHGDTFGTMAICDPDEGMHSLFTGLLPEHPVIALPRDDASIAAFDAFLEANAHRLAAIITEPLVQGAGGMILHEPEVLRRLRKAADRYGLSLIFDEIFTGFCRTGAMFAFTLSKALTGGTLPLAATIATAELFTDFLSDDPQAALMHGPTFMANAMGCAAANASLDLFETEPRLAQALRIENQLTAELNACRALRNVVDVRVKGAIGVVQLSSIPNPAGLRSKLIERGVWIRPFGNVVYLTPALTIEQNELTQLTDAICNVLSAE